MIAFFDIDGTLTSEVDASIPDSAVIAIRKARENGHMMFINTGRCAQNVEMCFRKIGFDGYVCGCGTNIYYNHKELLYVSQSHEIVMALLQQARRTDIDIVFESRKEIIFDRSREIHNPDALKLYYDLKGKHYDMSHPLEAEDYTCDKFIIWFTDAEQLAAFRTVSDKWFVCIDRGNHFREFVPIGYSKATGIQFLLDELGIPLSEAYAFGDSNNDLPMLQYVPNSIAMGNAENESLFEKVAYVTAKASEDGIQKALEHFKFI